MLNGIDAVIFDLDGTLVDSMWIWKSIDVQYLNRFGITLPEDLQNSIAGMSFSETAVYFKKRFNLPDTVDQIKTDWNGMASELYRKRVALKEGALELLTFLQEKELPIGIATSNSRELTELIVGRHGISDCFSSIRTSCEVEKGKPSPDIYLLVANDLGAAPNRCLVFEDIPQGIMAGKNAEMKVCAVYDDFSKNDSKENKKLADYYIHSLLEVLDEE